MSRKQSSRTSSSKKNQTPLVEIDRTKARFITSLVVILFATIISLALFDRAGIAGQWVLRGAMFLFGVGTYLLPFALVAYAIDHVRIREEKRKISHLLVAILCVLSGLGFFETIERVSPPFVGGGVVGHLVTSPLIKLFDPALTIISLVMVMGICLVIIFSWIPDLGFMQKLFALLQRRSKKTSLVNSDEDIVDEEEEEYVDEEEEEPAPSRTKEKVEARVLGITGKEKGKGTEKENKKEESIAIDIHNVLPSTYVAPPLSLLARSKGTPGVGDIKEVAEIITRTLSNFNIEVTMEEITVGPSITRYAMKPSTGTKLSKILGLENELSLALAAHPIRIEAPIPGKSLVGIEIPNRDKSMIGLGSMLDEPDFKETTKPLLVSLGKGISGKPYFANIAKMPHILIAGATGAGKSVTVHNVILSLLYGHGPEEVRLIMVDPKRVELTHYDKIPHLLTPVIKHAKKAILALKWATGEMDRRYDVLEQYKVRDIDSYHSTIVQPAYKAAKKKAQDGPLDASLEEHLPERMPYIVIIIDELADLMQLYPRELEASIVRLAQMSRAVGIHLLLSTQRPSVNVITGLIKANIPTRLALRVSSQIDSRTILDHAGAETLLGAGDMLYRGGDMPSPERVQCAYVSEDEIKKVVDFIIKNNMSELYDEIDLPETADGDRSMASGSFDSDDEGDDLFEEAREIVIHAGKASTSYIQRKLRVGYSRAARLMDMLEEAGVIGPGQGSKPRDVLVQSKDSEQAEFGDKVTEEEE